MTKVRCIVTFNDVEEKELKKPFLIQGDKESQLEWETTPKRAKHLVDLGLVKIVEEKETIVETTKLITDGETVVKETKVINTKKKVNKKK